MTHAARTNPTAAIVGSNSNTNTTTLLSTSTKDTLAQGGQSSELQSNAAGSVEILTRPILSTTKGDTGLSIQPSIPLVGTTNMIGDTAARLHGPGISSQDEENNSDKKVRAVLKARTLDGRPHLRPLCTFMDVTLAIQELFELRNFRHGCVTFPNTLRGPFIRDSECFYRYSYARGHPPEWHLIRYY